MMVIKCDICKKAVRDESITVSKGFAPRVELCQKCGAPIIKFLRKHEFIKERKNYDL